VATSAHASKYPQWGVPKNSLDFGPQGMAKTQGLNTSKLNFENFQQTYRFYKGHYFATPNNTLL